MRVLVIDVDTLARNWWLFLLRGIAGIVFGVITFFAPGISLAALVLLFGAYALADGVFAIWSAIRRHGEDRWWLLTLQGLLSIAAAVVTVLWPGITALVLLYVVAAWALVTGVLEIAVAIRLRKAIPNEWLLVVSGIASVVLGVLLAANPALGALVVVLWIGAYALVSGAMLVALSLRLRRERTRVTGTPHATPRTA